MKILLSPSKTQHLQHTDAFTYPSMLFENKTQHIVKTIQSYSSAERTRMLKSPKTQIDRIEHDYLHFGKQTGCALLSYTGESFRAFKDVDMQQIITNDTNELLIFSALYGLVRANDTISAYRLDMTMRPLKEETLYNYWKEEINTYLEGETIISLAAQEFTKILTIPHYTVSFRTSMHNSVHTVLAKQLRGYMSNEIIIRKCATIEDITKLSVQGFTYVGMEGTTLIFSK